MNIGKFSVSNNVLLTILMITLIILGVFIIKIEDIPFGERGERLVRRILAARGYRDPERVEVLVTRGENASRTVVVEVEAGEPWRIACWPAA